MSDEQANDPVVGHKTFSDGAGGFRHEPLLKSEADAMWQASEERRRQRAEAMPDDNAAIHAAFEAHQRLQELGWKPAIYCPKDGSLFEVIEPGSTGIALCHYQGEWPTGSYWIHADNDLWPSRPMLFRPLPNPEKVPHV